ncbi:hypothetical protein QMO56_03290 [Roseomonas sp. E05]|uniref:hypothetical protein n=1 Tax=Roseomonas sp. E05 TaxID=3046310 RepID=UPI0024BB0ADA|nr:hypothetical protein [Roseomonas sp. E05]MDJ0387128.1 hypothetical protein [Roseomonas sp. E05]
MTTAVQARLSAERRFYASMALFMLALVFIGFAPSFYLRDVVYSPRPNPTLTPLVLLHGLAFTAWMLLLLAQTMLVTAGRRDLHMRLGQAGMALAVLMIPLMYLVTVGQVARANQPPFATPLGWTAIPLFLIPPFAVLVALGWWYRRNPQAHKRLMLGAALLMMDPAIGRLPIGPPLPEVFAVLNLLSLLTFAPLLWWDWRSRGRPHWATLLGAGLFAAAMTLRFVAMGAPGYAAFAAHLPGV